MSAAARFRDDAWWLTAGSGGMLLALLLAVRLGPATLEVRWSGVALLAVLAGLTTTVAGPRILPLTRLVAGPRTRLRRGAGPARRLRPLAQGALVGLLSASVAAVGVTLFPDTLAPIHVQVGRGIPDLLINQLLWAVALAGASGALLGLVGWAVTREPEALRAFLVLVRHAGLNSHLAWMAAGAVVVAALASGVVLAPGAVGAGGVADRLRAVADAGSTWTLGWTLWGVASLGLLAVLVVLIERAQPSWRLLALTLATIAVAIDLVATTVFAAALPAVAAAADPAAPAAGELSLFAGLESLAATLSGPVANGLYGLLGLALIGAAGRALHPLVRLLGRAAFLAALIGGVLLAAAPQVVGPAVGISLTLFVAFATGLGWQLAVSRRSMPGAEAGVRRAVRALVPLHPVPAVATATDLAAVDLAVDPDRLAGLLPDGTHPQVVAGRAHVLAVGATMCAGRPAGLPRWLGLPPTPVLSLRVPVLGPGGEPVYAFLRGWADGTLTAATLHWTTIFELSRVDLRVASGRGSGGVGVWSARGRGGSVTIDLVEDAGAPAVQAPLDLREVVAARGEQQARVPLDQGTLRTRPARIERIRIPYLEGLGAEPVGAVLLDPAEHRLGRARWQPAAGPVARG